MLLHCSLPSPVFDKYVYILWWCIRDGNVRSVLVSFHHQNWCFISIFAAIFAAASHILCDMNEIFSVWLNLSCAVRFGSVWFGIHCVMQFSVLMVDLFFFVWVSVSMQRFCVGIFRSSPLSLPSPSFSLLLLRTLFREHASQVQATQNVRVMPMQTQDSYKLYRQNHKRNILPCRVSIELLRWLWTSGTETAKRSFSLLFFV